MYPRRLDLLLDHGLCPDSMDYRGITPLMYAASYDNVDAALSLLAHNGAWRLKDQYGQTFLAWALTNDNQAFIRELISSLQQATDPNMNHATSGMADEWLRTHLTFGGFRTRDDLEIIFSLGANPNIMISRDVTAVLDTSLVHNVDNDTNTTLSMARDTHQAIQMLEAGFSRKHHRSSRGRTPLTLTMPLFHPPLIQGLIDRGAALNVRDVYGSSPLHFLIRFRDRHLATHGGSSRNSNFLRMIETQAYACGYLLLEQGADSTIQDRGRCPCTLGGCSLLTGTLYCSAGISKTGMVSSRDPVADGNRSDDKHQGDLFKRSVSLHTSRPPSLPHVRGTRSAACVLLGSARLRARSLRAMLFWGYSGFTQRGLCRASGVRSGNDRS